MRGDFQRKNPACLDLSSSANAAADGELIKHSSGQGESDKFRKLQDRHAALADNEQGLADRGLIATGQ